MRAALDTSFSSTPKAWVTADASQPAKAGRSREQAQNSVLSWIDAFEVENTTTAAWRGAMDLCVAHQLSSWDDLVLNVAAESGARLLLTEDLHPGLKWQGVRVLNPFSDEPDPLLTQLLT